MKPQASKLATLLVLLGAGSALITAAALVAAAFWQSGVYDALARRDVDALIVQDLDHITLGAYALVAAEGEAVEKELLRDLKVARCVLENAGGISFSGPQEKWTAVNQFTHIKTEVLLPSALVGGGRMKINRDPAAPSPVVDDIVEMIDGTATVFQRMNDDGDMVRIATTVLDGGKRAVGTYIPATQSDGSPNPVLAAVLAGSSYLGRAFVVNAWYLTAYEPIVGPGGRIDGMLYVGRHQAEAEALVRKSIIGTRIGETGYVYVLSGRGENRGRYIISQYGARDGEDIWNERDSDGRYVIQDIIGAALKLKSGELGTVSYLWRNPWEEKPRKKIARLAYYEPWDWVIGTSAYEDELAGYRNILARGRTIMVLVMTAAGILAAAAVGFAAVFFANRSIVLPVEKLSRAAESYTKEGLRLRVEPEGPREIRSLAAAFNGMARRLQKAISVLEDKERKYRSIFEGAVEGILQSTVQGKPISVNPALARMLGYASQEDFLRSIRDLRSQMYANGEARDDILSRILKEGVLLGAEAEFQRADGTTFWVSISARALKDPDGTVWGLEGFVSDIDARKRAEETLVAALREKETLLREIHHRVKNNLQILASLVSLQSQHGEGGAYPYPLGSLADRIQAMALIHEMAYESANFERVDIKTFAGSIADNLYQTYRDHFGNIEVEIEGDAVELDLDKAIPCGLLLNEALSNSFRHAFSPSGSGKIRILIETTPDGGMRIELSDNGRGMPEAPEDGMGLRFMELLTLQLDARLETFRGEGTRYSILLPPARGSRAQNDGPPPA